MSKRIRAISTDRSQQRAFAKILVWILAAVLLVTLLCGQLTAQDAAQKISTTPKIKFAADYDLTKPEFQKKDGDDRDTTRRKRALEKVVKDRVKAAERKISSVIEGSGDFTSLGTEYDAFMRGYVFAQMTQLDEDTLSSLGEIRTDFLKDYLSDKVRGGSRQRVIQTTIPILEEILEDVSVHPAVRHNAVTLLGLIDAQTASRTNGTFPAGAPEAVRILVRVFTGAKYPSYLKIAAAQGLERHAEIDFASGQPRLPSRNTIAQEALAIVNGGGAGQMSDEARYWLTRRSINILGYFRQTGTNGAVLDALKKIVDDSTASPWLRMDAMIAIGNLRIGGGDRQRAQDLPKSISTFVAEALENDSDRIKKHLDGLIAANILFDDTDLIKEGNADGRKRGAGRNIGFGGGGSGALGDGPGGAATQQDEEVEIPPKVELPVYHLNNYRQKAKALVFHANKVIVESPLKDIANANDVTKLQSVFAVFLDEKSDIGIVDLDAEEEKLTKEDPDWEEKLAIASKSDTLKMSEAFAETAKEIRSVFGGAAPKADQPAASDEVFGN